MAQGNLKGITKKLFALAFLVGGLSIAITAILGSIYVRNYPFHSNPCDFPVGDLTENQENCEAQITTRGYQDTVTLIKNGLLPKDFIVGKTVKTAAECDALNAAKCTDEDECEMNAGGNCVQKGCGTHTTMNACNDAATGCVWDGNAATPVCKKLDGAKMCVFTKDKCRETAGSSSECDNTRNSDGTLKDRNGPNDKCLQTRVPEICKQTGFVNTAASGDEQSTLEKLADAGHNAELAFIIFIVVAVLGSLSLLNIAFHLEYGFIPGITCFCGWMTNQTILKQLLCAKKNDDDRYHNEHEAYSIWLVLLLHEALLIVFGVMAMNARNLIQEECYDVTKAGVYGDKSALEYIKDNDTKDAFKFEAQGERFYTAFLVFWWITVISAGIKALGMFLAVDGTDDMNIVVTKDLKEINLLSCKRESASSGGEYGGGARRVQLRGQF